MTDTQSTTIPVQPGTAAAFIKAFTAGDFSMEVAPKLTCEEAIVVHTLLTELGAGAEDLQAWRTGHELGDDEPGDLHSEPGSHPGAQDPDSYSVGGAA